MNYEITVWKGDLDAVVIFLDANPIIKESFAKQLLRTKRQKPGHPDEPMRVGSHLSFY